MRLRHNVVANIAGTAVGAVAALLSAPLIFRWLGADAYGLVGVYVLLQALMPMFDAGITPGLARAAAWHRGRDGLGEVRTLVGMAQRPVILLAAGFFLLACALSGRAARDWLGPSSLPTSTVHVALILMAAALALRMLGALNRGALMALERQVDANAIQAVAAVARTFGSLVFAMATDTGVIGFFATQPPISLLEWWAYRHRMRAILSHAPEPVSREDVARHLRFGLGVAGLSAIWLLTSQVDKFVLSRALSLPSYGAYSLGVHLASVILLAAGTIHGAALPRLTQQFAREEHAQARDLYGVATAVTVAFSLAAIVALLLGGPRLLPSLRQVDGVDPLQIAAWYAAGNASVALLALAYQLQNAAGQLRLHAWATIGQALVQVPLIAWIANSGDALRTAMAFAGITTAFTLVWLPVVHARFLPGGHWRWMRQDFLPSLVAGSVVAFGVVRAFANAPGGPVWGLLVVACAAGLTCVAALVASRHARDVVRAWRTSHGQ